MSSARYDSFISFEGTLETCMTESAKQSVDERMCNT